MKNTFTHIKITIVVGFYLVVCGAQAAETSRVSIDSHGIQADSLSSPRGISANGRFVTFLSFASNLVANDMNNAIDTFVHDHATGKTTRVSVSSTGIEGNSNSMPRAISADGRFIIIASLADNLVNGDTNNSADAFVHDRLTGKTTLVSLSSSGKQGNAASDASAISADGRFVVFVSVADNLVAGDTNGYWDVFVRDRKSGKTTRVSVSSTGKEGNGNSGSRAISADGRFIAFSSSASNLVDGDGNGVEDAFIHDRMTGKTTRISVSSAGEQGNAFSSPFAISADGRFIAFDSLASNLVDGDTNGVEDAFVHDRITGKTMLVSSSPTGLPGNDASVPTAISADGRFVAIDSLASNLVDGDTNGFGDAFVHDRLTGKTTLASLNSKGEQASGAPSWPEAMSADGRFMALYSEAANLVAGDTNDTGDAFVRDRLLNKAKTADLQVMVVSQPASVKAGQLASYKLKITNSGPDNSDGVVMTNIISNGEVTTIVPSQGTCSNAAISVCRLGNLAAGAKANISITIRASSDPLKQQINVNAAPKDDVPDNNAIVIRTSITP